jgi:hypothetical protein
MQTFIPLATTDPNKIAEIIDNKRLHKQALEAWQILMVLLEIDPEGNPRKPKGWVNHPAVKMWRGNEAALYLYAQAMVREWKHRGFKSTLREKLHSTVTKSHNLALLMQLSTDNASAPQWMADQSLFEEIASSHRKALLVKDYKWYSQFNWPEDSGVTPTGYDYIWPL